MTPASDDDRPSKPTTPRKQTSRPSPADPKTPAPPAITTTSPDDAPNSAPAAGHGSGRMRSNSKKHEPTLLSDFFLGRQSAARVAADRKRRKSVEAVRAEMRHEMRQGAVRKLQQPGGVKERVGLWQRTHASAMASGNPRYAATEPSDVAFDGEDLESVTEEDRVRIKMRQKRQSAKTPLTESQGKSDEKSTAQSDQSLSPPKKRVVSDENWMRARNRKSPSRKVSPALSKGSGSQGSAGSFVMRPTPNPPISSKIKTWAAKIEAPEEYESGSQIGSSASRSKPRPKSYANDGIYVKGSNPSTVIRDDGIRVRPTSTSSEVTFPGQTYRPPRHRSKSNAGSAVSGPSAGRSDLSAPSSEGSKRDADRRNGGKGIGERLNDYISNLDTATKSREPRPVSSHKSRPPKPQFAKPTMAVADALSSLSDNNSNLSAVKQGSDLSSNITAKTLADISGDIPFGQSAFSELDLSVGGTGKSRPKKVDRSSSLKTVPNVLKKVMEEGKKMMKDMNEPPRQAPLNKPPSIETWLNTTVDPFVDRPAPVKKEKKNETAEDAKEEKPAEAAKESEKPPKHAPAEAENAEKPHRRRAQTESSHRRPSKGSDAATPTQTPRDTAASDENETAAQTATDTTQPSTPTSTGLKRTRAKRSSSSPLKGGKKEFLGMFKNAFQGESASFSGPPKSYQTQEHRKFDSYDDNLPDESIVSSAVTGSSETSTQVKAVPADSGTHHMAGPRFRPPTQGRHELSTIVSDDGSSAASSNFTDSDMGSRATQSTLTQSTALSKDSQAFAEKNPECTLKRKLTRHSDLMSVLSLPDNNSVPQGINRSRPSLRRNKGVAGDITEAELLKEFTDDENLYGRELKTLVDGVLPVLLSDVVSHTNATNLFGGVTSEKQADKVSKSVVGMGVALEKLKNAHKKAPVSDIRRLAHWAHGVVPIYNGYLNAWRLGFQDLVVNLAPLADSPEDENSLLDALPRNENGDVVNANGERVAVAHLLKRPLIRIKQMTKLIKCLDDSIATQDTSQLLRDFEQLQDKARRRNREEIARITDEDAINTDTTRSRDLRTLEASEGTRIATDLQVNAKDTFSLDLAHSNGQRLECQVELVQRDNQQLNLDGDLLIREVGAGHRSYLLFPPVPMNMCSARTGDGNFDMVLMIRGTHKGRPWHELLTLSTDNEDQILDWLDLLPLNPVPPREPEPSVVGDEDTYHARDIPVGAAAADGRMRPSSPLVQSPRSPATPTARRNIVDADKTPTQDSCAVVDWDDGNYQTQDDMLPKPLNIVKSPPPSVYREDGAPPPPAHRSLPSTPQPEEHDPTLLAPPPDPHASSDGVRRRRSSPLKHEYLPSDRSSANSSSSADDSDADSSDDDIDSMDIPETELGVSITKEVPPPPVIESILSQSDCSVTPSNSASQAGLFGPKVETAPENTTRFLAALSRWSDRGTWKDLTQQPCAIVVSGGLVEAYAFRGAGDQRRSAKLDERPLIALDLTPLVLIRQSTALDLEIRSSVQTHSRLYETYSGGNFRFRCHNAPECFGLYMAVHHARLNNQKFIQLENEARFRSFGERNGTEDGDGKSSGKRRSWFGRKNSYRGSVRAPAQSAEGASTAHSSTPSASSFLKRLTATGNNSFNLAHSSVDRQYQQGGSGRNSLYTSGSSSASGTPPRSPSASIGNSGGQPIAMDSENIRIRLHLLVSAAKWEDYGNCILQIRRPPAGWRQALRADHGLEKRVTVTALPKKETEQPKLVLDAVLGSGCFSSMGSRGIVCGVWEEVKGAGGVTGVAPDKGGTGGMIKKWCFQLATAGEASWVLRLVHQEVLRA